MTGLAILLFLQQSSRSFAVAGATTGCYIAGLALIAPALGRLIDRKGPRIIVATCGLLFPAALGALVYGAANSAPTWLTLALALGAGGSFPPITVCMRSFLRQRLGEQLLAAAYSLESVLIELMFVFGPLLVALFVALGSAALAVLFSAASGLVGAFLFLGSPALQLWRVEPRSAGATLLGPLAEGGFVALIAVILCYSIAFGMLEIGVTAYATERGRPALAGLLLGLVSVGSAFGGLIYGSRGWRLPLARQFASLLGLMGFGIALLALSLPLLFFAALCLVAGSVMAPALIVQSMLVAQTARPQHLTEAFTWSASALLAGIGAGFAAGGALLEFHSSGTVLAAGAASALLAGLAAPGLRRR
jgi:MFS transporter